MSNNCHNITTQTNIKPTADQTLANAYFGTFAFLPTLQPIANKNAKEPAIFPRNNHTIQKISRIDLKAPNSNFLKWRVSWELVISDFNYTFVTSIKVEVQINVCRRRFANLKNIIFKFEKYMLQFTNL